MNDTTRRGGLDLATIRAAPKVAPPRPPRRRPAPGDRHRARPRERLHGPAHHRPRRARPPGSGAAPTARAWSSTWQGFAHTVGVMQTPEAIERVAAECAEDLAADGIVYAEVRFAPELHLEGGLTLDEVVEAVLDGFRRGSAGPPDRDARPRHGHAARRPARSRSPSWPSATATTASSASTSPAPRPGYPPTRHLDAFQLIARENFHFTIHAGEAFGLPSIWEALQWCGAERLGHGVRIVDDITVGDRRSRRARAAGSLRPRPAHPARDVPDLERPHGRRRLDRGAPDRPPASPPLPGHGEHRQPPDERGHALVGVRGARPRLRLRPGRDGVAHAERA